MSELGENWSARTVGRLGGAAYDFVVEREWLARPGGIALWGTDTRLLFDSIRTLGEMPDGSAVLDVPCGGGIALRGLRQGQQVRYVAADISPDMLARAGSRHPRSVATTLSSPKPTSSKCRSTTANSTCA
jgi:SAM-dependent methyltransferase